MNLSPEHIAVAKSICNQCPVKKECLEYANEYDIKYGVWGGMTAQERQERV